MVATIQVLVLLLAVVAAIAVVSQRIHVPNAILLVLAGVALALIPGLPAVELAPELVLLIVLPPLIYWAAVSMSWREFRLNLGSISLLAVGCVVFTTIAVAVATHALLGLSWPVGFVVGAILSPPDAVAPLAILRRMQLPRRLRTILEAEGVANDATALVLYRFAVGAVGASTFSLGQAGATFAAIVVGEILWGIGVGWLMLRLRQWVRDPQIEITLSLLTPYLAYWPPEHLGGSGVLATVTTGLYFSWNGLRLISSATRLQGIFFWGFMTYLIEGLVFLITGLQARTLIERIGAHPQRELWVAAAVVSAVVILARFVWVFPATYLAGWLAPSARRRDGWPAWQGPFVVSYTGVRGIVSLAAALALPFQGADGQPFPGRDMILFLTFSVILLTLVAQGLTLPFVVRAVGLAKSGRRELHGDRAEENRARRQAIAAAIERLEALATERGLDDQVVHALRARHRDRLRHVENHGALDDQGLRLSKLQDDLERLLLDAERGAVNELFRIGELKDDARRRIERELDLRQAELDNHHHE